MTKIDIGTCVPGSMLEAWLPALIKMGYECFSINFHMSLKGIDLQELAAKTRFLLQDSGAYVASLGFYCNPLQYEDQLRTLEYCIDSAELFGARMVSTFAGGLEGKSVPECMSAYGQVFGELAKRAESKNITLAIENCGMGGTWKNVTCNIAMNPEAWEMMFNEVQSPFIGLEWEPAHQIGQLIDPIKQLKQWAGRVVHLHGKDASVDWDALRTYGLSGTRPYVQQRTPGFGDTDWREIFTVLYRHGYTGNICVEGYHDPFFRQEWEMTGQQYAFEYLNRCRGGMFVPNPPLPTNQ